MGCGEGPSRCARCCLLVATTLLAACALVLLYVSISALVTEQPRAAALLGAPLGRGPALLVLSTGALALLVALLGCCGALCRSTCLLGMFALVCLLLLILSLAGCVAALVVTGPGADAARQDMLRSMARYNNDTETTKLWDFVQRDFACCGVTNGSDWSQQDVHLAGVVPDSCCRTANNGSLLACTNAPTPLNSYVETGCLAAAMHAVAGHSGMFGMVCAAVAVLLGAAAALSCCLIRRER